MEAVVAQYNQLDAYLAPRIYEFIDLFGADLRPTVELTKDWYWVHSPTPIFLMLMKYTIVVGLGYLFNLAFPKKEKKEDGAFLKLFVSFHNFFLAVLSAWMGASTIFYVLKTGYNFWGESYVVERDIEIAWVFYVFYLSKFYEFLDTYIMLIKGNLNQVSFLHVYHHFSTAIIFWMVSKQAPGGDAWFCINLNSWVHVVMYTYYFLTTIIKSQESRKKYLWWGRYLTQFQLSQFFLNLVHAFWCFFYSPYWYTGKVLQSVDMTVLLILFGNFYIKKYIKPAKSAAVAKEKKIN